MNLYRRILALTLTTMLAASCALCFSQAVKKEKEKDIYNVSADARAEIKEALQKAAAEHKRVIVVFGANWCYDCHVLDKAFHRSELASIVAANYVVVHVDIGKGDKNQDLMEQYEVPMKRGIPGLAVLDSDGNLLYSQKNGEFENARALAPADFMAFLNQWKPAPQNR
jgi:thiol:disulfide interchange protein